MAETQTGKFSIKKQLKLSDRESAEFPVAALPLLGLVVALLHSKLGYSLGLPGHHGLELMTALLFARLTSTQRWAGIILITGTIGGDLVLANDFLHNLKHAPLYFLSGFLVDVLYMVFGSQSRRLLIAAVIGALAHVSKPIVLFTLASFIDIKFGFFRHGMVFPLLTYPAFAIVGAICGALLARAWQNKTTAGHNSPSL